MKMRRESQWTVSSDTEKNGVFFKKGEAVKSVCSAAGSCVRMRELSHLFAKVSHMPQIMSCQFVVCVIAVQDSFLLHCDFTVVLINGLDAQRKRAPTGCVMFRSHRYFLSINSSALVCHLSYRLGLIK